MLLKKLLITIFTLVIIQGCSLGYRSKPKPEQFPPDDPTPHKLPLSRYGNPKSYEVFGVDYYLLASNQSYTERGVASWYGDKFHGKRTSSGEPYNMYAMTAAHKTLPIPVYAQVTNLENGHKVIVKINDRGPFVKNRLIDLSYAAAIKLGVVAKGTARVEVTTIIPASTNIAMPPAAKEEIPKQQTVNQNNLIKTATTKPIYTKPAPTSTPVSTPTEIKLPTAKIVPIQVATVVATSSIPIKVVPRSVLTTPTKTSTAIPAPQNSKTIEANTKEPTPSANYFIQIGAFSDKPNALRLIERIKLHNDENFIIETVSSGNKPIHKVKIGPINTIEQADLLIDEMKEFEISNPRLIISN